MMDHKATINTVITAIAVSTILALVGLLSGVFSAGSKALDEAQIRAVINQVHMRDNATTYGASLASIDNALASIDTSLEAIKDDVDDLETAVTILASE